MCFFGARRARIIDWGIHEKYNIGRGGHGGLLFE